MAVLKDLNDKVYKIIGSCMETHKILGPGYPVDFYKNALNVEFESKKLKIEKDKEIKVLFKEVEVGSILIDYLIDDKVIVSLRSQDNLKDTEVQQVLRCLQLTGSSIGVLVNFGAVKIQYKRILPSHQHQQRDVRKDALRYGGYKELGRTREGNPAI